MIMIYLALIEEQSDKELFEELYYKYRSQMLHLAISILNDHDYAEDAVHNAFTNVAINMQRYNFNVDPRALLLTITKNCSLSILRKLNREKEFIEANGAYLRKPQISTEENYENKDEVEKLSRYVARLSSEYEDVFTLRYRHRYKTKEIAAILGISDAAVRKRLQRIKQHIDKLRSEEE